MEAAGSNPPFRFRKSRSWAYCRCWRGCRASSAHIAWAAEHVVKSAPDGLILIDSPDFTHRVARRVRAKLPNLPVIDYVSPTIWAWRPGRARKMRAYVDKVLALLPFEPAAHERLGGPNLRLCRPSPDRAAVGIAPERRGAGAARRQAAGGAGAAGLAALGSGAADGRTSARRSARFRIRWGRSTSCCRRCRICTPK